jgi:hypothetical protein
MKVQFKEYTCDISFGKYHNGQNRIQLMDEEGPVAVATVALQDPQPEDWIYIKDYAENAGMLACLMNAGILSPPVGYITSGYVEIPVCKLLVKG